jgi:hypothetical protein
MYRRTKPGWRHTWDGKVLHFFRPEPVWKDFEMSSCGLRVEMKQLWSERDDMPLCKKCEKTLP